VKPLRLLIALLVLGALAGAVWYSERHPPELKSETTTKTDKIISTTEDQVQKIEIAHLAGGDTIDLGRGDDGKWRITAPKQYRADESTVSTMVTNLATLNADQLVNPKNTDWKPYGLDPGKLGVTLSLKNGKQVKLTLGDDVPAGSGVYARLGGDPRLFTIARYVKSGIDKSVLDLRDKRILPFDSEKVSRVTVKTKDQTLEFDKAGTSWQIVKPHPIRADNFAVDDIVRSVQNANFDSILDESGKPTPKYSFSSPYAMFEAVDPSGVHTLTIGKDKDNTYYTKTSAEPGVFKIASTVAEGLNKKLDDLRNKKLFDFGWSDPQKLEVRDGDLRMTIEKKGDKWQRTDAGNKQLASEKVQTLIDHLRNLSAASFPSDDAAAQAKYGLNKPLADLKVTSDGGKRVERVLIAAGPESKYYAARENEPAIYQIDNNSYDDIHKAIEGLK
jgi:hypothetical protein